jgi:hypothetical protein
MPSGLEVHQLREVNEIRGLEAASNNRDMR